MKYENDIIMADNVADESYSDSYSSILIISVNLNTLDVILIIIYFVIHISS